MWYFEEVVWYFEDGGVDVEEVGVVLYCEEGCVVL